jgi:hypothetical protein
MEARQSGMVWAYCAAAPLVEAPPNGNSVEGELTAKHRKTTISVRSMRESLRELLCEGVTLSWVRHSPLLV